MLKFSTEKRIDEKLKTHKNFYPIVRFIYDKCVIPVRKSNRHLKCVYNAQKRRRGFEDKRYAKIKSLKNVHQNKRCFIICTGPSLTIHDVNKLKNEYTFGMNTIFKLYDQTDWRATYYGIIDVGVFERIHNDSEFKNIQNLLVPDYLIERYGIPIRENYIPFPLDYNSPGSDKFSDDAYILVYDIATVTYTLMQIAVHMGFTEIYLLGCDCDYSGKMKHFSAHDLGSDGDTWNFAKDMTTGYRVAKQYADAHGIKIYNATRGGKLEVFERVDFDSLF